MAMVNYNPLLIGSHGTTILYRGAVLLSPDNMVKLNTTKLTENPALASREGKRINLPISPNLGIRLRPRTKFRAELFTTDGEFSSIYYPDRVGLSPHDYCQLYEEIMRYHFMGMQIGIARVLSYFANHVFDYVITDLPGLVDLENVRCFYGEKLFTGAPELYRKSQSDADLYHSRIAFKYTKGITKEDRVLVLTGYNPVTAIDMVSVCRNDIGCEAIALTLLNVPYQGQG